MTRRESCDVGVRCVLTGLVDSLLDFLRAPPASAAVMLVDAAEV